MIEELVRAKLIAAVDGSDIPFTVDERKKILRHLNWMDSPEVDFLYAIFENADEPILIPHGFVSHLDDLLKE